MTQADTPTTVGQQLAGRRESLDLTQGAVASRVGISVTSVSSAERDRATIMRSKRAAWEQVLRLKTGTISKAYADGSPLEPLADEADESYADLNDPHEAAIMARTSMSLEDRHLMIDMIREAKREGQRRGA